MGNRKPILDPAAVFTLVRPDPQTNDVMRIHRRGSNSDAYAKVDRHDGSISIVAPGSAFYGTCIKWPFTPFGRPIITTGRKTNAVRS
jgi:hypothetical protein